MSTAPASILDLSAVDEGMLSVVGGKAGNLGVMLRAGLPVPPGFCVTTEAYRQVADTLPIDFDALAAAPPGEGARDAARTRDLFLRAPIPEEIARDIAEAYARLGGETPVAVRSSATAEDLPFASFAGQQDTYLHIIGAEAVIDAVRRCWASLWTDRAVVYRSSNGIDHRTVRLAVVVQRMVAAEVAGVLFTANPVTGRRHQAVIDASPGLGEAVVSGAVNPDHFVVDTERGTVLERRLGDKRVEVRPIAGGGTRHVERSGGADRACVTDNQVQQLAALGDRVERHYGAPQDIEWAIDPAGALWLTQSRPITTLFPLPSGPCTPDKKPEAERAADFRVYFCFSVAQGIYRPFTPMGLAAFRLVGSAAERAFGFSNPDRFAGAHVYAEGAQRVFLDMTGLLRNRVGRALFPRILDVMEARSAVILRHLAKDPRLSLRQRTPFGFLRRALRIAFEYGIPPKIARALVDPGNAHRAVEAIAADLTRKLEVSAGATSEERLDFVARLLSDEVIGLAPGIMPFAVAGLGMFALASKLLGDDATPEELQTVLRALPHNVTTEMDLEMWRLAVQIRGDEASSAALRATPPAGLASRFLTGSLPPRLQSALTAFLERWGHRAIAEIDVGMPRWSDDPSHVLGVLANYLRLEDPRLAADAVFARGAEEAEAMAATLVERARRRGRMRARIVRFALHRARQLFGIREAPKYYMVLALAAVRRQIGLVGQDLAGRERLERAEDVFFLDLLDARAALGGKDMRPLVGERRAIYDAELRRRHVPRVILSDGTEPENEVFAQTSADGSLGGTPASSGAVTGVARVILDPVGAHLDPGEILVAPSTDPGWTPLFLTAGGLVMEMGGANSHGAVVAREYGIPAVVGVANATHRIRTGQRIRVDGTAGVVSLDPPNGGGAS